MQFKRVDALVAWAATLLLLALPLPGALAAQTRDSIAVKPGSRQNVPLGFTVANPQPRPDLEARMLRLVNEERKAAGRHGQRVTQEFRN